MKKLVLISVALVTLGALGVFTHVLVHATAYAPESLASVAPVTLAATSTSANHPSRLLIPSLSIDAHIQSTTITKRGTMGTPTNFTDVAWYEYGAVPGDEGGAVIDGHVDNGLGLAGVFKNLATIVPGADVFVTNVNGGELHFIVTSVKWYDYKSVPMQALLTATGTPRLAFITCGGDWIKGEKTYDQRLVVETVLATSL